MNWLDIVLLFIFVISIIGGARSGLIKSVTSLAALILGVVLAVRFYPQFGLWLQRFIANQTGSRVVAFVIILAVVLVAGAIASYVLGRAARALG
ncbi:MAG: CvpA family protein, partial [Chloroflexi bacterium]|nr:CvpA family protein [Chloroflexota bacterium]